jgi:hypothetical protein
MEMAVQQAIRQARPAMEFDRTCQAGDECSPIDVISDYRLSGIALRDDMMSRSG